MSVRHLTAQQVADRLGLTRDTIYDYVRQGLLPALRPGVKDARRTRPRLRFRLADLEKWELGNTR